MGTKHLRTSLSHYHRRVKMMTNGFPVLLVMVVIAAVFFLSVVLSAPTRFISPYSSYEGCSKINSTVMKVKRVPCGYLVRDDLVALLMDAFNECSNNERSILNDIHRLILDYDVCKYA